jgi:hypothetical protein
MRNVPRNPSPRSKIALIESIVISNARCYLHSRHRLEQLTSSGLLRTRTNTKKIVVDYQEMASIINFLFSSEPRILGLPWTLGPFTLRF